MEEPPPLSTSAVAALVAEASASATHHDHSSSSSLGFGSFFLLNAGLAALSFLAFLCPSRLRLDDRCVRVEERNRQYFTQFMDAPLILNSTPPTLPNQS